ncbi:TetR/AcrR family transcriptional regulator [Antrihabitans cavernicola]|uniref:TetR family transcriptional regulator n=1 Tax=Antrihabitans cavernicola TaxID=2495913 RepID=A0A5A7SDD9_9NOCA|nr:TetR family transcriptional regulator [Spelaeibacter cavernicola]KAA0022231.1 TetR family transcriptional regulator [Spelaeibacter cavernicola]
MSRRSANGKPTLSKDAVVEAALDIAHRNGVAKVTIRKLADTLDVSPMAIYWHVENKDELFEAMGDRVCRDFVLANDPAAPWHEQLRTIYTDLLDVLTRYPGAAAIVVPRMLYSENGRAMTETSLALMRSAGFDVREATQLARHGTRVVIGLVVEPLFTDTTIEAVRRAQILDGYEKMLKTLPHDKYPHIVESAAVIAKVEDREEFNSLGIDTYINGLIALAEKKAISDRAATPRFGRP